MPSRVRLTIALVLTAILLPAHQAAYHVDLNALGPAIVLMVQEIIIGAVLGMTARLAISALQVAGTVVAQQIGLGFVTAVDPTQNQQGMVVGNFLTVLGVALIFATDLHYLVIAALNDSYNIFAPGVLPLAGDVAQHVTRIIAASFRIGIQISAPFLVFGLLFNFGLGVLSRLMPQMQVFFIGMPLSILLGLLMLLLVIGAMMGTFTSYIAGVLSALAPPG
jgi:flagellar biosynthetic protein FliR